MGSKWRDVADRRPHVAVLAGLLIALVAGAGMAPAAVISFSDPGPVSLLAPSITGDARIGGTLTCTRGTWDDSDREPYAVDYEWFDADNGMTVDAGPAHTVTPADAGRALACAVTAHDRWHRSFAPSFGMEISGPLVRSAPALSGDDRLGGELTCAGGAWDGAYPLTYAWLRDGDPIEGETATRHRVVKADAG